MFNIHLNTFVHNINKDSISAPWLSPMALIDVCDVVQRTTSGKEGLVSGYTSGLVETKRSTHSYWLTTSKLSFAPASFHSS